MPWLRSRWRRVRRGARLQAARLPELLAIIRQIALPERGAILIVEEDLRRAGDPALGRRANDATFQIDANIYHYLDAGSGTSAADLERFLIGASSGYPLNAFVTPRSRKSAGT